MFRPHTAEGFAVFLAASLLALLPAGPGASPQPVAPALTADGKLLFVACGGAKDAPGCVFVWNLAAGELRDVIPGTPGNVRQVQPIPDGKRFVLITGDPWSATEVAVYDTAGKKRLHTFPVKERYGVAAAVSPDGEWVALRARGEKPELQVWNTATGKRAAEVEAAAGPLAGALAFTADSKLALVPPAALTIFDPATGKKVGGWTREHEVFGGPAGFDFGTAVALLPGGKGFVSVAATGKRRQSYVVRVATEKGHWFLGESWDYAGPPIMSPDGRLLLVSIGGPRLDGGTFALKLGADGAPELADPKGEEKGPLWRGRDEDRPAWRAWALADKGAGIGRAGDRAHPEALAFAPDGKRLFAVGSGRVQVFDAERRTLTATLFAGPPAKDDLPAWHILTAAGEFVGSAVEAETLEKAGKVRDAAKVRAALGVK